MLMTAAAARAQVVADGATNTLSNVTNTITGDVIVGTNGSFTLLVLSVNTLVTNSVNGTIGLNAPAKSNEVRLLGPSARWQMGGSLFVGNNGSFNRLVVSNGATVRDNTAFLGANASGSNNLAVITGPGSVWSNANVFYIGFNGAGNQLVVSNGGVLRNNASSLGVNSTSSNNLAVVTGSGSLWSNASSLQFSGSGGNHLMISNGGFVRSALGALGLNPASSNNLVAVTGSGSTWSNASELYIGNSAAANQLLVSAGGAVHNGQGYVGANATASNNLALITGAGSVWSNALDLNVGAFSSNNRIIVSNGATVFAAANGLIGPTANGNGNSVTVTDPGTRWLLGNNLYVGSNGAFNMLLVNAGGTVEGNNGSLGFSASSSSNLALVTGAGSIWSNRAVLNVGETGSGNRLVASDGGRVECDFAEIGRNALSGNNEAVLAGAGSSWTIPGSLLVGDSGSGNRLIVSNSAAMRDDIAYVGFLGSNNTALVTGSGSVWTNGQDLYLGYFGPANRLMVSNGGRVANRSAFVGFGASSSNNTALVSGSGSVWSNAADFFIGRSGSGNRLDLGDGAAVYVGGDGGMGINTGAGSNLVSVTDPGTRWQIASHLYVGSNGPFNRLLITNGATVFTSHLLYLGFNSGANSNIATVTGPGSALTNLDYFFIGQGGAGNQLIVSNGASARAGGGFTGIGLNVSASNNAAVVTGADTRLQFRTDFDARLDLGRFGRNNQLTIADGGQVSGPPATLIGFDSSGNLALVTGPHSAWTDVTHLYVGYAGLGNRLVVSNGAMASVSTNLVVGDQPSSANNRLVVDDGTLRVTNATGTGVLDVRRGTNVLTGGLIEVDRLVLTNVDGAFEFNSGTLITRGANIANGSSFIVGASVGAPAVWDVRAGASNHVVMDYLNVGYLGSLNQLLVTNGAVLSNKYDGFIGVVAGANSNTAVVAATGSRWEMGGDLRVGLGGSYNSLVLSDSGSISNNNGYVGHGSTANSNAAVVMGSGSAWRSANDLYVGVSGAGNRLVVGNGGTVRNNRGYLGGNTFSSNNLALVTGAGSLWTNGQELYVGLNGSGNELVVSNGATVFTAANKVIGYNDGAWNNTAVLMDPGSRWLGGDSLYVGSAGSFNRLIVREGAQVTSGLGTIGGLLGANHNQALLTGPGSLWTNQLDLAIGDAGMANVLVVSNAARVISSNGVLGLSASGSDNLAVVTGPGSVWSNAAGLYVGARGSSNQLVLNSGGTVLAGVGVIGTHTNAIWNAATMADPGTRWLLSSNLYVGSNGALSRLVISNGALVGNSLGVIGNRISGSNNAAVVTGSGSVWSNASDLYVGYSGHGSQLVVSNGGVVWNGVGYVGYDTSSSNNVATVTGAGSVWSNAFPIMVGISGAGNRLVVSDGGAVRNNSGYLGLSASSSNNSVWVTGPGSAWSTTFNLSLGQSGPGAQLVVSNGGVAFAGNNMYLGFDTNSTNNRVVVDGGTLRTTNSLGTSVFDVRRGTNLLNAGLLEADQLLLTNAAGRFEFNGGTLSTRTSKVSNGQLFRVGNGVSPARFALAGNGAHSFGNGLTVSSNATLSGDGNLGGMVTVASGGTLFPGASVGKLILSNSPALQGTTIMEISKNGAALTNDQVQVAAPLPFGGSLLVSNLGPTALAVGDRFPLFNASSYSGSFSNITLPPLAPGLAWTNKLAVDGSVEIVPYVPPPVALAIQRSNDFLVLSWPTNGSDYCLETAFDLSPPVNWQPLPGVVATDGAFFVLSLPNAGAVGKQFFRLAFPCSPAPATLSLQISNSLVTVNWPSNSFRLETAFDLAPPVAWHTISNGINDSGGQRAFSFTNDPATPRQFFRLASP